MDLEAQFTPARLTADIGHLSAGDRAAMEKLIENLQATKTNAELLLSGLR